MCNINIMLQYLVIIGALANVLGSLSYARNTIRGVTKPNRVSWLMWSIAPFIATGAALSDGVTWTALPVFMSGFCPFMILVASFFNKNAYWKLNLFDYICGAFSVLALILWWISKDPSIAIFFAIISDLFAAIPTITKSWNFPESESSIAFSVGLFSAITSLFALKLYTFSELGFPVYLIVINLVLVLAIERRRIFRKIN